MTLLDDDVLYDYIMSIDDENYISHVGIPHEGNTPHSGRYEWGSGAFPNQRPKDFVGYVERLKKYNGLDDNDIALGFGFKNLEQFQQRYNYEKNLRGKPNQFCPYVDHLRADGYSEDEVANMVGLKDAKALADNYGYSKAVWSKVPEDYKLNGEFADQIASLKKEGYTDAQLATAFDIDSTRFKARYSIATNQGLIDTFEANRKLIDEGITNRSERARKLGIPEATLRSIEKGTSNQNAQVIFKTADMLKEEMQEHKYLDVGPGVAQRIGLKRDKLNVAIAVLKEEGYEVMPVQVDQHGTVKGNKTTISALVPPGVTYSELKKDVLNEPGVIHVINSRTEDDGESYRKVEPPTSIDSSRIYIRYGDQGGIEHGDGMIELRRGVKDISLGDASYAQVRIAVDGKYYLKGMAMHKDNIPDGYDIVFNTNKKSGTPLSEVLKPMEKDETRPFGASTKDDEHLQLIQRHYIDDDGKEKLSAINVVNEEGDWSKWSKNIASQVLAKQKIDVIKKQLDITLDGKKEELDTIKSLTNPVVKQRLLFEYADSADKAAVNLKAMPFPGQSTRVILPYKDINENEIYAPGYENGETVCLIRYPHGGIFEIPRLKVNNKYKEAKNDIGQAIDAVGINYKTASVLSGADFDGDTVLVIPVRKADGTKITDLTSSKDIDMTPFQSLREFEPKSYKLPKDISDNDPRIMKTDSAKGMEMGKATNLIADLTLAKADPEEIVRAVKYSMVVIDSKKHKLDWKQARKDFDIAGLNKKYRGGSNNGASTLITRAKSPEYVKRRTEKTNLNAMTTEEQEAFKRGEKVWNYPVDIKIWKDKETGEVMKVGKSKSFKSYRMLERKDARELINKDSPTQQEYIYANFANGLKKLALDSRKTAREIATYEVDNEAKKKYAAEVQSLKDKVTLSSMNSPLERKAQALAGILFKAKKEANPDLDEEHYGKESSRCLDIARKRVGASKYRIKPTEKEWEAIQARAISKSMLDNILNNADMDYIKKLAMPREEKGMSDAQINRAKSLLNANYEITEIANMLGVPTSTIYKNVNVASLRHAAIEERLKGEQLFYVND